MSDRSTLSIYAKQRSPRLDYTLEVLFGRIAGIDFQLFTNPGLYLHQAGPKLNYSTERLCPEEIFIPAGDLLYNREIIPQALTLGQFEDLPFSFPIDIAQQDYPFDLFSFCFFLLSRYEEYLPFDADELGRFPAEQSLAFEADFLHRPLVDEWGMHLRELLIAKNPDCSFQRSRYQFTATYDIDLSWAFLERSWARILGASLRSIIKGKWETLFLQWSVLLGQTTDPYDCFEDLDRIHNDLQLKPIYFFLLGKVRGLDRGIHPGRKRQQALVQDISKKYSSGLHPSFNSNLEFRGLGNEFDQFKEIIGVNPVRSRQHYLMLRMPDTYRKLLKLGIKEDYSMGYAKKTGFRASIARSYPWYDLEKEETTKLELYPFAFMDVSLKKHLSLSPEQALAHCTELIQSVKHVNGHLISIWHNSSFAEFETWTGWWETYQKIIKEAIK